MCACVCMGGEYLNGCMLNHFDVAVELDRWGIHVEHCGHVNNAGVNQIDIDFIYGYTNGTC